MNKFIFFLLFTGLAFSSLSQRQVFKYPIEFTKGSFLMKNSYYLNDPGSQNSLLILKYNKNAEYLLLDKNMKLVSKFSPEDGFNSTVFKLDEEYIGGTAGNGKYYFAYEVLDGRKPDGIYIETVEPASNTVSNKKMFDIPKDEIAITTFSNYGKFFSVTADNSSGELKFYSLNAEGKDFTRSVKVNIPTSSKKKKLSDYLEGLKVKTEYEEPGIETATEKVKLFYSPGKITITVNEGDEPVYLLTINTETFAAEEKLIDHSALTKDEKGRSYINSYVFGDNLYSLVLNKKNIRIATYNSQTSELLKTHEINETTDLATFAAAPIIEERRGMRTDEKSIDDAKKLIKALDKGSEAIMIYKDKKDRLVVSVGTYDMIPFDVSKPFMRTWSRTPHAGAINTRSGDMYRVDYNTPGQPSHIAYNANFYKSTNFKLLLDPATLSLAKGAALNSVNDQIKDYLSNISEKAEAKNQFTVDDKQYFGYYDRKAKMYVIEEIIIRR